MKKIDFLGDKDVEGFVSWAAETLPDLQVTLNITRRGTGRCNGQLGPGVQGEYQGLNKIVNAYHWKACWVNGEDREKPLGNWKTTQQQLRELRESIQKAVDDGNEQHCFAVAREIVIWGGDIAHLRNQRRAGAVPYLQGLSDVGDLVDYLRGTRETFALCTADLDNLIDIQMMNSMLSKVHALLASDGLPIYDSRVAAAIGALVELYRQLTNQPWLNIPESLRFRVPYYHNNRQVRYLQGCIQHQSVNVIDPGVFNAGNQLARARQWASAKIRLGWLLDAILEKSESNSSEKRAKHRPVIEAKTVLDQSRAAKMHAFEAGLFMIGFNVTCLCPALVRNPAA